MARLRPGFRSSGAWFRGPVQVGKALLGSIGSWRNPRVRIGDATCSADVPARILTAVGVGVGPCEDMVAVGRDWHLDAGPWVRTHDYLGHGTLSLMAALDHDWARSALPVSRAMGTKSSQPGRRGVSRASGSGQLPSHRHRKVQAWLEANPAFHCTLTCPSWLNPVEQWSGTRHRPVPGRYVRRCNADTVPPDPDSGPRSPGHCFSPRKSNTRA